MKIKELIVLSFVLAFFYFLLVEGSYILNFSVFSFAHTFKSFDSNLLSYLTCLIIIIIFYILSGLLLNRFWYLFPTIRHYYVIAGVLFVIDNFFMKETNRLKEEGLLQSEISLFFIIIFTTTLFFYSIHYVNLLKYQGTIKEKSNDYSK